MIHHLKKKMKLCGLGKAKVTSKCLIDYCPFKPHQKHRKSAKTTSKSYLKNGELFRLVRMLHPMKLIHLNSLLKMKVFLINSISVFKVAKY